MNSNSNTNSDKTPIDQDRIAKAVKEILCAIGEDVDREGLQQTPQRVARMYAELFAGMYSDPKEHLKVQFTEDDHNEMIIVRYFFHFISKLQKEYV